MIRPTAPLPRIEALESRALLAAFTGGNVVVYRVGAGGAADLVNTGNPVFLDEYSPAGTLVQSIALPATDPDGIGPNRALVTSGVATSEGNFSLSADGRYLIVPGYASVSGGGSLATTSPSTVNRVVGRVDASGVIDTSTYFTDGGSNNIRSAASSDGSAIWVATADGGVRYLPFGNTGTTTALSGSLTNVRVAQIFGNQLYTSSASGSSRLLTVGTGLPTSGSPTVANLPGISSSNLGGPYGYFFADLSPSVAGVDTLYVADDTATALRKFSLVSGTWTSNGSVGVDADDYRSVTGTVSGSTVTLYATRKGGSGTTGGGELVRLQDASGYNGAFTGTPTVLATAASRAAFRGVALTPQNPLPDLTISASGPATATRGVNFNYSLTVGNSGAGSAAAVAARLTLPTGISYVSSSATNGFSGSASAGVVTFTGGSIASGTTATLTVTVSAAAGGTYTIPAGGAVVDPASAIAETNEANNLSTTAVSTVVSSFAAGNLVVYRVGAGGAGAADLVNTGNPVFLDEYSPAGTLVQSIALPATDPDGIGPNRALVTSGVATSEGNLTLSADGRYLIVPGYASVSGSGSLASTSPATVNRVVGRVDASGVIDTSTYFTDGGSNNIRSAASSDGSAIWVATGDGGVRYLPYGNTGTTTALSGSLTNVRVAQIFDNQLYTSSASGSNRLLTVGSGLPTSGSPTVANLPGISTSNLGGPYGYFFADLSPSVAGVDTLYVSDDTASALQKFSLVGGVWTSNGIIGTNADDYRSVTGIVSGTTVTLYATRKGGSSATGGGELVSLQDASGYNGAFSGTPTLLASAATRSAFRGVAFAPTQGVATPADLQVQVTAPASASVGANFAYTLTTSNVGGTSAANVTVQFTVPANLTYVSSTVAGGFSASYDSGTRVVMFTGGSLPASGTVILGVTVTPTVVATVTAPAGAAVVDPSNTIPESNDANNSSPSAVSTVVTAANTAPTIVVDTAGTTRFLSLPAAGPGFVSGVISDLTDPARTLGIVFTVADAETSAGSLTVNATSGNTAVVTNANLEVTGSGSTRTLKITPTGVGYATINVTVSDGSATANYVINYAASAASATPAATRFITGASDASTAIAIDANYMLVGDDENQVLRLYDRANSGLPLAGFDFTSSLGLTDISGGTPREVDIEAAAQRGSTIYWLGSHANSPEGNARPNRSRVYATTVAGTGATTTLTYAARYDYLKSDLIAWDNANGHGLGAGALGLAASAATGVPPETAGGSGFNIEGLTFAPDGNTAYLAFRAPISPASSRTKALIVPVTNFLSILNATGGTSGSATFGAPILLDLGGLGIREIKTNGTDYVIIAGPSTSSGTFQLFTWNGNPASAPVARGEVAGLVPEGIVSVPTGPLTAATQLQLVSDLGDTVFYADGTIGKDLPQSNFKKSRVDTVALGTGPLRIRDIQGASHISPFVGQSVSNIPGIVTALDSNGFYLQDPTTDGNDATSEAIFVFTSSTPTVAVGHSIRVSGNVSEFQPGGASTGNLTLTEIINPVVSILSAGNALPAAVIIGSGGRTPPTTVIDDDSFTVFDPANDGIDFYESLEGMRVQINNGVSTGPTNRFGEISVLADNGAGAGLRTSRGGIIVQPTDFNPERIILDDGLGISTPVVHTGATFGTISGVMSYDFGNFKLLVTSTPTVLTNPLTRETTTLRGAADALTIGSFNAENLDPGDGSAKFSTLASIIVSNLGAPDILTLEEIQDNNGATNNGVVDASVTYQTLINAIVAAGGPTYIYRQIDPVNNQDGGEPGGNIRVAFLFNPARVSFVDRAGGTSTLGTTVQNVGGAPQLTYSPGRINPTNSAFNSSRKPLAGEFLFNGQKLFVIANHWNSKGGDEGLFEENQPPTLVSEVQRNQQAQIVQDFVQSILAVDPNAKVVLGGDLNDFYFSNPLKIVTGVADLVGGTVVPNGSPAFLTDLITTLPVSERYTYVFDGNSQDLDHILATNRMVSDGAVFDSVHVNSEFSDQASDHDPLVARFVFQVAPTNLTLSGSQIVENAPAGTAVGTFSATDANLVDTLAFSLTNSASGLFAIQTVGGSAVLVSTAPLNFEAATSYNITARATDSVGNFVERTFVIQVQDVPYELTGFDVQKGQTQRSFVRYADIFFQDTTNAALQSLINGGRVQLLFLGTTGTGSTAVGLTGRLAVSAGQLNFDAGTQGIGGNRNSNAGDGFYRFQLDLDFNGSFETTRTFFRLFGDVDGDRQTTQADRDLLQTLGGAYNANLDVNGDGVIDARDRLGITLGRSLTGSIAIDD